MTDTALPKPLVSLPKEPLDLPREPLDLPLPEKELSRGQVPGTSVTNSAQNSTESTEQNDDQESFVHNQTTATGVQRNDAVKTLLSWHAPDRIHHKKGREYFINIILIILILEVLLFLFHQFTLMILLVTLGFLACSLAIMPPNILRYRISNQGIALDESFFLWKELYDFYFTQREGEDVLHIRTVEYYPGEIVLHLGQLHKDQLISTLLPFLPYRESVRKTFMEKSGDWLSRTFPLDKLPSRS